MRTQTLLSKSWREWRAFAQLSTSLRRRRERALCVLAFAAWKARLRRRSRLSQLKIQVQSQTAERLRRGCWVAWRERCRRYETFRADLAALLKRVRPDTQKAAARVFFPSPPAALGGVGAFTVSRLLLRAQRDASLKRGVVGWWRNFARAAVAVRNRRLALEVLHRKSLTRTALSLWQSALQVPLEKRPSRQIPELTLFATRQTP